MASLQIRKHIMTGISYMIPYVCAAGMLMVIFLVDKQLQIIGQGFLFQMH